nr:sulfur carrier protein ThiS [uncultured Holophaga sp.]
MILTVNGKERVAAPGTTLAVFIESLGVGATGLIAELNGTILKRDAWGQTVLNEGDRIELVSLVGGG